MTRPLVKALAACAAIALIAASSAQAAGTPEQRRACRKDAMKYCREFVPDVKRITACMQKNVRKLSPLCRTQFRQERGGPMHIPATLDQARSTLAVMLGIAATEGMPTEIDHETIAAATRYIFHLEPQFGLAGLTPLSPYRQAELADDPALAAQAVSFAAVMAFVGGSINPAKLSGVVKLADSLNVKDEFVHDLARIALGDLKDAKTHMLRANLESITGRAWASAEMAPWLQPYDAEPDPALATRFHALARLPETTFGHAFATFYQANGYAYPGEPTALNFEFAVPHDSTHVLAGYDTSPRGELLTSTLTATMHRAHAMAGHVLPVILSWHLGIPLNDVAGSATGAFEPEEFFYAWARGEDTTADLFAPEWDFWSAAIQPIDAVREEVGLFVADDETQTGARLTGTRRMTFKVRPVASSSTPSSPA